MVKSIDAVRRRLLEMHLKAGVGHLGGNLSCIDALVTLYQSILGESDRFILSKGHAAGALYAALWSVGRLTDEDLNSFHAEGTALPGHPPAFGLEDVVFATGSLGHGLPLAVGLALAMRLRNSGGRVFCLTSDGEWQEGSMWEALAFASHHRLANLCILVDANRLQGFGRVSEVSSLEPLSPHFSPFRVKAVTIDGHQPLQIEAAIRDLADDCPTVLILNTVKGKGIPRLEDRLESHYLPLREDELGPADPPERRHA